MVIGSPQAWHTTYKLWRNICNLLMITSSVQFNEWGLGQYMVMILVYLNLLFGIRLHSDYHQFMQYVLTFLCVSMSEAKERISVIGLNTFSGAILSTFSLPLKYSNFLIVNLILFIFYLLKECALTARFLPLTLFNI